ncbi:hypothetical protein DE146DRAFT_282010 [Phaeosphaeria sp. MPI-PUGE-AT-0046c]|nr:hypothetical protein DE146DRAFT_282010 [Phaeosphaeria sp. MPI-PUGE-AT-0046c]
MRINVFLLALFLFICVVGAQWGPDDPDDPDDDNPQWPGDPDDDDPPSRPTPTRRPTSTRRPTPTRPTSTPNPEETEDPGDPPEPVFTGVDVFANATVYQPDDATHHLTSPRTENMPNNTILAVWNDPAQLQSTLSLYQSSNNGFSWFSYGTAKSTVSGRKLLEPHLLFVEGSWSGDTNLTLLAVNAVDAKSTNIEIYVSYDKGVTFEFVHRVAEGGAVGAKAVGEPHLLIHDKRLTVYYSDRRDTAHAQKISQQSSTDLWGTWGTAIDVAVSNDSVTDQRNMASVAKLPNKAYILIFGASSTNATSSAVTFKITTSPENVGTELAREIITSSGLKPQGAPFVTWSALGGVNGTIVVSDSASNALFINQALGEGMWKVVRTNAARAYGREVHAVPDKRALRIIGGSEGTDLSSDVMATYINFESALGSAV